GRRVLLPGIALSAAFWALDSGVDALVLTDHGFFETLLHPSALELWVRLLITAVTFGFLLVFSRARKTGDELAMFARAVEEAQDGVQLVDLQGKVAYSNRAIEAIYGFTPAELEGHHVGEMNVDPEFAGRTILPAIATHGRWEGELAVKHRDGHPRQVWLGTSMVKDRAGRPSAMLGIIRDVTSRRKAEETLLERERLAALGADVGSALVQGETLRGALKRCTEVLVQHLDAAFARIWTLDAEANVLELQASAGLYTRLDGTHSRVPVGQAKIGQIASTRKPVLTNRLEDDAGFVDQAWAKREGLVAFAGYPLVVEDRLVGVMAMFARKPLPEATLQALAAVANSIALGVERSRAHEALQTSEQRFRRVFEDGPTGMSIIGLDRCVVQVNAALCQMVGRPEAELLGKSFDDITHPEDVGNDEGLLQQLFSGQLPVLTQEKRFLHRSGEVLWIHLVASVLKDKEGKPKFGLAMIEDVTSRRRAADALREAKDRAEAADRTKAEFLDIASHELRTPLTALRLQVQHTLGKLKKGQAVDEGALERIERQTGRLSEMVNDLLDASRLERGRMQLKPVPLDLRALVASVSDDFRARAPSRPIPVFLPSEPALVEADPTRIEQVIANFLDNALKYSPEGTPIDVSLSLEPDQVRLSVADHGLGIPLEQRGQLFNRFFRVDANLPRQQPGLGLGLYICRMIIKPHGGTIGVDSEIGRGSTFHFTLPRRGELR
ncbi:MAG: sensor histidine kinase, partial [Myxococcaceae bacterium]